MYGLACFSDGWADVSIDASTFGKDYSTVNILAVAIVLYEGNGSFSEQVKMTNL